MMLVEVAVGAGLAVVVFLALAGQDVTPFLLLAGAGAMLYWLLERRAPSGQRREAFRGGAQCTFDDVGGQETAKQELREALEFMVQAERAAALGIRQLKGVLLVGPPGTGKTLLARAAAGYTDAVFLAASGSEFVEVYAGVGAQRVRGLFRQAREMGVRSGKRRAIIFLDELEVLGGRRGSHTGHLEYDQTLNQLLVEMDGLRRDDEVRILVLGATNRPDMLDPALLRPGRFDRQVRVDLPDREGRRRILELHCRNKPLDEGVDLDVIARATFGFSGAHLESLANEAAILALREGAARIRQRHLQEAIDKVMLGEKLPRRPEGEERYRVAVHEAGHALVSELGGPGSVAQVSIISRGQALGYVRQAPADDLYLYTGSFLRGRIRVCLAGAVAEELLLGEKSTGAGGDYKEAVRLAHQLVQAGLTPLGVVDGEELPRGVLHRTVSRVLREEEEAVRAMLREQKDRLLLLAETLSERESISGDELRALLERTACA